MNVKSLTLKLLAHNQYAGAHLSVANSELVLNSMMEWIEFVISNS